MTPPLLAYLPVPEADRPKFLNLPGYQHTFSREYRMSAIILTLLGSIILVFVAAIIFVNTIEWLGHRFRLGGSFVGAILAPLFTSFPELIIFLVAVFSVAAGSGAGESIGIGTLFGQPFMASSLSYGLIGIAVIAGFLLKQRKGKFLLVNKSLAIPYIFITALFPLTIIPSVFSGIVVKYAFGALFLGGFLLYIWLMYRRKSEQFIEEAEETYISRILPESENARLAGAVVQLLVSVGLLFSGSELMVSSVGTLSQNINISPLGLALIIIPIATAIPETISALIWGFHSKDTLSLGALVGEKILYSTFYPGLGILITSWQLDIHAYLSIIATTVISIILLIYILRRNIPWYGLLFGLGFFLLYVVLVLVFRV
jgi:cation:H+ antiporter